MNISQKALDAAWEAALQNGIDIKPGQLLGVIHTFIDASGHNYNDEPSIDPDLAKMISGYTSLTAIRANIKETLEVVVTLPHEDEDWQFKRLYDHLFEGDNCAAVRVRDVLSKIDRTVVDYYDPDTTYKADAEAYIEALDQTIENVRAEIASKIEPVENGFQI